MQTVTSKDSTALAYDIRVVGAREHNLKEVSLRIPKNRITVFVGVSGSGKSIADVLEMSAWEAAEFFSEGALRTRLGALIDTGLGYLGLGQSLSTLSGGERQRIKLADQLSGTGNIYILDEPTTGLHLSDIDMLLNLLHGIVDRGNTVVVIEHHLAVIGQADWIIDLGPDGGKNGGEIVFTGTPEQLVGASGSLTGEYLRRYQSAWEYSQAQDHLHL